MENNVGTGFIPVRFIKSDSRKGCPYILFALVFLLLSGCDAMFMGPGAKEIGKIQYQEALEAQKRKEAEWRAQGSPVALDQTDPEKSVILWRSPQAYLTCLKEQDEMRGLLGPICLSAMVKPLEPGTRLNVISEGFYAPADESFSLVIVESGKYQGTDGYIISSQLSRTPPP